MEIIRPNRMKRKLTAGQPVFGAIITILDPELVEIAGIAGLDYIWMDFEHINLDWERAQSCVLAAELHGITPILRPTEVPGYREYMIQRALNIGFQGAVLTGVRNPQDMRAMLDVMKFWPAGRRGVGHGRVHERAGDRVDQGPEVLGEMNDEVFAAILVESAEAVEKIDDSVRHGWRRCGGVGASRLRHGRRPARFRVHPGRYAGGAARHQRWRPPARQSLLRRGQHGGGHSPADWRRGADIHHGARHRRVEGALRGGAGAGGRGAGVIHLLA